MVRLRDVRNGFYGRPVRFFETKRMALAPKLELRQGQTLVMTPQLQQAIKLLQLSNLELSAYVEAELERNPLLEHETEDGAADQPQDTPSEKANGDTEEPDWVAEDVGAASATIAETVDADNEAIYPEDGPSERATPDGEHLPSVGLPGTGTSAAASEPANLEAFVSDTPTLADHVAEQINIAALGPQHRLIAAHLADHLDDAGYLRADVEDVAERLGAYVDIVEDTLEILQGFEPAGLFARSLQECLALQLKERDRYDPAMALLIENLPLLAKHDYAAIKAICEIDDEDLSDMILEIKALNPKPGLTYGYQPLEPVVPDVIVTQRNDGGWNVELNAETLPRVLVNQTYYARVSKDARDGADKTFLIDCHQNANWLVKSLEQRSRTILKVASEIVRQQDGFLTHGIAHLKPLNLRAIADAVGMHESTVSRVTSSKYMATPRGIFELKYFFTAAIQSTTGGDAFSAEAVRHRIKTLIDGEAPNAVLSDDAIVQVLRDSGIDIARRTVAKYRESLDIPSSVQRRRQKKAALI